MLSIAQQSKRGAFILASCALISCSDPSSVRQDKIISSNSTPLPPISDIMPCLGQSGPIIALHRGRDKSKAAPENSLQALTALYKAGYIMAEVDVAQLKDDTLILFHDGVWEEKTTGRGAVAATTYEQASKYLLTTKRGVTAQNIPKFEEVLTYAKGRFYLEIDFKSSANERDIIAAIKTHDMQGQVILIGYSIKQSRRLHKLLPQAMISAPIRNNNDLRSLGAPKERVLAWAGTRDYNSRDIDNLSALGVHISFGMMSPRYAESADYSPLGILVTDYPDEARRKAKIKGGDKTRLDSCRDKLGL